MCFLSQKRLFPHEKVVPTQHETLDSKKPQCVAATSALTALGFPQLLSNVSFMESKYCFPVTKTMLLNCYNIGLCCRKCFIHLL